MNKNDLWFIKNIYHIEQMFLLEFHRIIAININKLSNPSPITFVSGYHEIKNNIKMLSQKV